MRQVVCALHFTGWAIATGPDRSVLAITSTAPGATFLTAGRLEALMQIEAAFESEMTVTGETSFQEIGTIAFGKDHRLRFSTLGSGYLGFGPTGRHGAAVWWVEGGAGAFAGAHGLITAQILLADDLTVTGYYLCVIFVG